MKINLLFRIFKIPNENLFPKIEWFLEFLSNLTFLWEPKLTARSLFYINLPPSLLNLIYGWPLEDLSCAFGLAA